VQDIIEAAFMITKPNETWTPNDYNQAIAMLQKVGAYASIDGLVTNLVILTCSMSRVLSFAADSLVASYEVRTVALDALHDLWLSILAWLTLNQAKDSAQVFKVSSLFFGRFWPNSLFYLKIGHKY
jgi:protein-S-isoprenylcysteine O-methyltransferase Ste14